MALFSDQPTENDDVFPPLGWAPTPAQIPLWLDLMAGVDNIDAITHRQLGKDELFMKATCIEATKVAANYVYCLPETEHLRKAVWKAVNPDTGIGRIDEAFPEWLRLKRLDNEMIIEIPELDYDNECEPTGKKSVVQFVGSDNHKALRGMVARIYNFSEWAFCDPHAMAIVRPIVERNGGKIRRFTTAYGENHAYKMLINNRNKPGHSCHLITNNTIHPLVYSELGVGIKHMQSHQISPDRMNAILEENIDLYGPSIGQAVTEQEYECSFQQIVPGSFYLDLILKMEREGRLMNIAPRPEIPVYAWFDIGYTDPTAIWYVQVKEDGWIDIIDYDEYQLTSIPELIPELKRKPWFYAALQLPHDGPHHEVTSGTTTEKILKAAGFTVQVMPRTDDSQQIPSVRSLFPRCRFNNIPNVKRGLDALRHYHNKVKKEGDRISTSIKAVHDWSSHGCKAFATGAYFAPELRTGVQPPKKPYKDIYGSGQGASSWMR